MYEHRMPCEPERMKNRREYRRMISTGQMLVLIWFVFLPLCILLLTEFVAVFGWIAFGVGILKLAFETMKHTGYASRWIPGYEQRFQRAQVPLGTG